MGIEIDLLKNYPKSKRNINERAAVKTDDVRSIARQFGKDFFDGDRKYGYGGFSYNPKFWQPVVPTFKKHFNLNQNSSLLDVGCAKGFMLYDISMMIPGISVRGIDISKYAIENAIEDIKDFVQIADACNLPFKDKSFDIVISINTIHNLEKQDLVKALQEIERVSRRGSFITVDAYRNDEEHQRMINWNLTAKTIMHVDEWINFFKKHGYTGDYFWFTP